MIKRVALERHMRGHGCALLREGGKHSVWLSPANLRGTVPRHREIPRGTVRSICAQLDIPNMS